MKCAATVNVLGGAMRCVLDPGHHGGHVWSQPAEAPVYSGDIACMEADQTPEGSVKATLALADVAGRAFRTRMLAVTRSAMVDAMEQAGASVRRRVGEAVLTYLQASERDWQQLWERVCNRMPDGSFLEFRHPADAIEEAKKLHDAQVAELFTRIGEAL